MTIWRCFVCWWILLNGDARGFLVWCVVDDDIRLEVMRCHVSRVSWFLAIEPKTCGLSVSDTASLPGLMKVIQWCSGLFVLFSHRSVHSVVILAVGGLPGNCAWWVATGWVSSGMSTVKVHEWCLVCYGWLALCLRNNFHLAYLFSLVSMLVLHWMHVGFHVLHA